MLRSINYFLFFTVLVFIIVSSCNQDGKKTKPGDTMTIIQDTARIAIDKSILDNLSQMKDLSVFMEALTSTDLVEILKRPGPFTVFAPGNEAFKKLPGGMPDKLSPERKNELVNMLSNHIVAGTIEATDLKDGYQLKTMSGNDLTISLKNHKITINGTNVMVSDMRSTNGTIYIIDAVLFPEQ